MLLSTRGRCTNLYQLLPNGLSVTAVGRRHQTAVPFCATILSAGGPELASRPVMRTLLRLTRLGGTTQRPSIPLKNISVIRRWGVIAPDATQEGGEHHADQDIDGQIRENGDDEHKQEDGNNEASESFVDEVGMEFGSCVIACRL